MYTVIIFQMVVALSDFLVVMEAVMMWLRSTFMAVHFAAMRM